MKPTRSGLNAVGGLGSAKTGAEAFWRQRLTSVLGLPLVACLMGVVWCMAGTDYASTRHLFANPVIAGIVALAIINFAIHMRLGAQVIIEDYIHRPALKALLLMVNTGLSYGAAVIAILSVVKVYAFG